MNTGQEQVEVQPEAQASSEAAEIFVECSSCQTLFRFKVTKEQAQRYGPPQDGYVQDIFPELPIPARAVLSRGNVCGMCLTFDEGVTEILKPYIVENDETF